MGKAPAVFLRRSRKIGTRNHKLENWTNTTNGADETDGTVEVATINKKNESIASKPIPSSASDCIIQ